MQEINLSILEKIPKPEKKVKLIIDPLAPLSMVNDLPGSFYKSLKSPSKKMLCGLFENILGWHIDIADRMAIVKDLVKLRKKQKVPYIKYQHGSTYIPLLMDYFEIESVEIPEYFSFIDLWSRCLRRAGDNEISDTHPKGTPNLDYRLIPNLRRLEKNKDFNFGLYFNQNHRNYPFCYTKPTNREYYYYNHSFVFRLWFDFDLFELVENHLFEYNITYLGNSEGWINTRIEYGE